MCLYKKSIIPRIALTPIKVYKFVHVNENGDFYTPISKDKITLKTTYKAKFNNKEFKSLIKSFFADIIDVGYIHSTNNILYLESYKQLYKNNYAIIECEIPKYTLYFEGYRGHIASRKLTYKNIKFIKNESE